MQKCRRGAFWLSFVDTNKLFATSLYFDVEDDLDIGKVLLTEAMFTEKLIVSFWPFQLLVKLSFKSGQGKQVHNLLFWYILQRWALVFALFVYLALVFTFNDCCNIHLNFNKDGFLFWDCNSFSSTISDVCRGSFS